MLLFRMMIPNSFAYLVHDMIRQFPPHNNTLSQSIHRPCLSTVIIVSVSVSRCCVVVVVVVVLVTTCCCLWLSSLIVVVVCLHRGVSRSSMIETTMIQS